MKFKIPEIEDTYITNKDDVAFGIKLNKELHHFLKIEAHNRWMSVNGLINMLLNYAVQKPTIEKVYEKVVEIEKILKEPKK